MTGLSVQIVFNVHNPVKLKILSQFLNVKIKLRCTLKAVETFKGYYYLMSAPKVMI